jgi:hypothetical protein
MLPCAHSLKNFIIRVTVVYEGDVVRFIPFFATFNFSVITTFRFRLYMLMDVQTSFDRNAVNSVRETENESEYIFN